MNGAEAVELGTLILRITKAIRKTGSERAYVLHFGEDGSMPHFHICVLARYLPLSQTERDVLYGRVQRSTADPVQVASDFAVELRANFDSTGGAFRAEHTTSPVPGCAVCSQVFDPERKVVEDTEHFVGYVTPLYPWAVMLTTRRHDCDGPWALSDAEAADLGKLIPRVADAIRRTGSERVYFSLFGEEHALAHFHLGLLSRYVPLFDAEHRTIFERVERECSDPAQDSKNFAAALRLHL
jgi:diadenosine tetraphosphate (Ap4A) HIT family hydrolase